MVVAQLLHRRRAAGAFIYAYSWFYFFNESDMDGLLQSSFYFGYMAILSLAIAVMLGSVGLLQHALVCQVHLRQGQNGLVGEQARGERGNGRGGRGW